VSNLFAPTKNHLLIFQSLRLLQSQNILPTIVCTGDLHDYRNPGFINTILQAIHQNGVSAQVRLLGVIPREHQVQLMRQAQAVLQPSLFEGWNTSVEEAHCLGKTLLLSDIPVHREQNPPKAIFFDPKSAQALAVAMKQVLSQPFRGVDPHAETIALENYAKHVHTFGETFLRLAND
jgi:glycosyltransferase involved in cell wall biosynthesis